MTIKLDASLPHQHAALEAINRVFLNVDMTPSAEATSNPSINIKSPALKEVIEELQTGLENPDMMGIDLSTPYLNLDVKMETGTGKTYVYTRLIYELHKHHGINKFVILVPTTPIKAGTEQFIKDSYVKRHFRDQYCTDIDLHILAAQKRSRNGNKQFPPSVRNFVNGSNLVKNKIHVLLVNMQMLTSKSMTHEYDYSVAGYFVPLQAIMATRPFVIIDEPHRFAKHNKTFEFLAREIKPQSIIRFGATFPETRNGRDYHNVVYNLGSCDAFNHNLVKGVDLEYLPSPEGIDKKLTLVSVANRDKATFHLITSKATKTYVLKRGDSLALVDPSFDGIHIASITRHVELTSGQVLQAGMTIYPDVYSGSYQDLMLQLALKRHFEVERENFRRRYKIKTLSLFFIDGVSSYRGDGDEAYLRNNFEKFLEARLRTELSEVTTLIANGEPLRDYLEYLKASLRNIPATHGGYFSQDNSSSDDAIAAEVSEILYEKDKLLSMVHADGTHNTRRFVFSKWTLREGWDNPNIFTIAKLRSSGSETSKLQEVGRGLRLPVDENGNRVSEEQFYLNYIVDFTERDFAEKLVQEINGDTVSTVKLAEKSLKDLAENLGTTYSKIKARLILDDFIDDDLRINEEKRMELFRTYPVLRSGLTDGKIRKKNDGKRKTIGVRPERYRELQGLWEKINQRYYLSYVDLNDEAVLQAVVGILETGIQHTSLTTSVRKGTNRADGQVNLAQMTGVSLFSESTMSYNNFLKLVSDKTNIPITVLHQALLIHSEKEILENSFFSTHTALAIIRAFLEWKYGHLLTRINYRKLTAEVHPTALTNGVGIALEEVNQSDLGSIVNVTSTLSDKYLYDVCAYDSDIELRNIQTDIDEITVYGKIPKNSIRIPLIDGATYSPDFMYVVKKAGGTRELNLVVESKDVESGINLRGTEKARITSASKFFDQLKADGFDVTYRRQLKHDPITFIIKEVLDN